MWLDSTNRQITCSGLEETISEKKPKKASFLLNLKNYNSSLHRSHIPWKEAPEKEELIFPFFLECL
jgi:hypothetical protein